MKKSGLFLLSLMMLTGCGGGSEYRITLPYGDGKMENDSIGVYFTLAEKIKNGYAIKGKMYAEKDAPLSDLTTFSLVDNSPLFSENYKETVLTSIRKEDFEKKDNGSYSIKFTVVLEDLSSYFVVTGEGEKKKASFFIHGSDFNRLDQSSYNTHEFSYIFDGARVTISY